MNRIASLTLLLAFSLAACSGDPGSDAGLIDIDSGALDSDGNGRPDAVEGTADTDGDGVPDAMDDDDDGDRLDDAIELGDRVEFPADHDLDGTPDFRDRDSDDDSIDDGDEGADVDSDGDGMRDRFDTDSDGDGLSDTEEAGDGDLATNPVDTDSDGNADYRDLDSDGDGLPDRTEIAEGSDRLEADSDDDGVNDLIESAAGTDPNDDSISPRTRGDFVFVMPFREPASPPRDTLELRTNVQLVDVYFLFDTTGSMVEELQAMSEATSGILDNLTCVDSRMPCSGDLECGTGQVCSVAGTCVSDPRISGCIASMYSGVGVYAGTRDSYRNLVSLQGDSAVTERGIPATAGGNGGAESLFESVGCVADPTACRSASCSTSGIGCAGFRSDAIRVLVTITDETNQCLDCAPINTAMAAGQRLRDERILFVAVDADVAASPEMDLKAIGRAANSLDASGQPYYTRGTASAVTTAVTDTIRDVALNRPVFVTIGAVDETGDDGDALQFIDRLEVNTAGPGVCENTLSTADTDGDGFHDAFPSMVPGRELCWDVVARDNVTVEAHDRPLVFRARVVVRGDTGTLDARNIYFVVPPTIGPIFG